MKASIYSIVKFSKKIQNDIVETIPLPLEVQQSQLDFVLHRKSFENTRGYILKLVDQINITYENTCYDACAVMIRRLIEVLIIETYDSHKGTEDITDINGNYFFLEELIKKATSSKRWTLGRNTKRRLKGLKLIGDESAHSRRYNAKRSYIDEIKSDLEKVTEELLYLSSLKT